MDNSGVIHKDGVRYLRLFEAKMVHQYNHRHGDYGLLRSGDKGHILPEVPTNDLVDFSRITRSRFWVSEAEVRSRLADRWSRDWLLGWRDITDSRASARTVIVTAIPRVGAKDKFQLILSQYPSAASLTCLLANLNAFVLDYVARQKLGGTTLNYFILKQFPVLTPQRFESVPAWLPSSLTEWISQRVLELVYTAWDLRGFAQDLGWQGSPFRWNPERRSALRSELDACFFHLYGLARDDVEYVMETFPVVRRKDEARFGHYQTKRLILESYDFMAKAAANGEPYWTPLDPPPAHSRAAHSPRP